MNQVQQLNITERGNKTNRDFMSAHDDSNFSHPIDPLKPLYFRVRLSTASDLAKRARSAGIFLETFAHLQVQYRPPVTHCFLLKG